jgi:hypothetical protein
MSNKRKIKMSGGADFTPEDGKVSARDIFIDEAVMPAKWTQEERGEWADWAAGVLQHGAETGQWPDGYPLVSDRAGTRGPNGERYVLLGFQK